MMVASEPNVMMNNNKKTVQAFVILTFKMTDKFPLII